MQTSFSTVGQQPPQFGAKKKEPHKTVPYEVAKWALEKKQQEADKFEQIPLRLPGPDIYETTAKPEKKKASGPTIIDMMDGRQPCEVQPGLVLDISSNYSDSGTTVDIKSQPTEKKEDK